MTPLFQAERSTLSWWEGRKADSCIVRCSGEGAAADAHHRPSPVPASVRLDRRSLAR